MRRRPFLIAAGGLIGRVAHAAPFPWLSPDLSDAARAAEHLATLPDKRPMIQLSEQPPILETPIQSFREPVTANDQFFVHCHHGIPPPAALDHWALEISGDAAERAVRLTQSDLKDFSQADIVAVCESAGNRRGLLHPHIDGVQWGHGGVGCAAWRGPRLRDVLARAGVKPEAVEIWFDGADRTLAPDGAGYRKSLPIGKALANETVIATSMNEGPLPLLNGYPARLVVPGWVGEYWIKHLTRIVISRQPLTNDWMSKEGRIPSGSSSFPSQNTVTSAPVTELAPYALIVSPVDGDEVERSGFTVRGAAWDRGNGILRVDISVDGGRNWQSALLDREIGPFGFRTFRLETGFLPRGPTELRARATSNKRETQPDEWRANPGGYLNNVPQRLTVTVV